MTDTTIWRLPQVTAHTGLSRSTIYSMIATGDFPTSINLGIRSVGWIAEEIEKWIQSRIDASRSGESE